MTRNTLRLSGRRILITGISRGIGFETARLFLSEGATILGVGKDADRLEKARLALDPGGERLSVVTADLESRDAALDIVRAAEQRFSGLDVLLNNAGVQIDGDTNGFEDNSELVLERSLAINLLAPYRLSLALLPLLRRGVEPRIINVSSGAGTFAALSESRIATYRLSKWALNGFTLQLAHELRGQVAVNAFDPGWVKTDLGGSRAPGTPDESARGALALVLEPFTSTGKFWKDGQEIPF